MFWIIMGLDDFFFSDENIVILGFDSIQFVFLFFFWTIFYVLGIVLSPGNT